MKRNEITKFHFLLSLATCDVFKSRDLCNQRWRQAPAEEVIVEIKQCGLI